MACDARNASKKIEFQCYSALTTIMTCHRLGSTNILGFVLSNTSLYHGCKSVLRRRKTLFADKSWAACVPLSSQLRRRKSDWRTPNYFWWEKGTVIYWSCCNRRTTPFLLAVFFAAKGENCQISFRDRQDKHCRSSQCAAIVILQKQAIFRSHRPLECVNYFRRSSLILLDANQPKDKPFRIRSSLCLLLVLLLKKSSLSSWNW